LSSSELDKFVPMSLPDMALKLLANALASIGRDRLLVAIAGEPVASKLSIGANSSDNIKPPSGEAWIIHQITCSGSCSIYITDGTDDALIDSGTGATTWIAYSFIVTPDIYLKIVDETGSGIKVFYAGVKMKW